MFKRFVRPLCKYLKTLCTFLIILLSSKSGIASSWCRQIWDVCGSTFFTCWRSASYWNSIKLAAENSKWDVPFPLSMNWVELHFYNLGHLRSGFQGEKKRLKIDFQGQPADLQHIKNVLPHRSQIWQHQLLAIPLLPNWSMMRNVHSLQIFTVLSYKPP